MNCAWCGANADGSDSHGICDSCAIKIAFQSFERSTRSYAEINAATFLEECRQVLEEVVEVIAV
jgi:hypothetical protein